MVALVPTLRPPQPTPVVPLRIHRVRAGETLPMLAERYAIGLPTLLAANDLVDPTQVSAGQELKVPTVDGAVHTLRPGETLRDLAEWYGVPLATLIEANRLSTPDVIAVDTPVLIPGVAPTMRRSAPTPTPAPTQAPADPSATAAAEAGDQTAAALTQVPADATAAPTQAPQQSASVPTQAPQQSASVPTQAPPPPTVAPTQAPPPPTAAPTQAPPPPAAAPTGPKRVADAPPPEVTAEYVAILDEASGTVLYGNGEHDRVAPASITKIATTLVAIEREPDLGRRIQATINGPAMAARDGSSIMGLEPGEDLSLRTLLFGMMLPSGNDAAEQVALSLGGSRQTFVGWMNERVRALGLRNTQFVNPSGMDANGHYSSAYDMALLGREAMRNPEFREMAGAATYRADGYRMTNLNRLIGAYPGADGIKIGSTRRAGKTIVASAMRNGHRVYVTLLRSSDLPGDSTRLFEWTWRTFAW